MPKINKGSDVVVKPSLPSQNEVVKNILKITMLLSERDYPQCQYLRTIFIISLWLLEVFCRRSESL